MDSFLHLETDTVPLGHRRHPELRGENVGSGPQEVLVFVLRIAVRVSDSRFHRVSG